MLLARIKEALDSLYDDIQETQEAPEAAEIETVAVEAAVEEPAAAAAEQEDSKPEEAEEPASSTRS